MFLYAQNNHNLLFAKEDNATKFRQSIYDINNKRKQYRVCTKDMKQPIVINSTGNKILSVIDFSRCGIGFKASSDISPDEIIPVHVKYKNIETDAQIKIVFASDKRAGAKFIDSNKETLNKLLLISLMIEQDNGLLVTDLKGVNI